MLWAALTLTVFSGIDYFVRFYRASDIDVTGPRRRSLALSALWLARRLPRGRRPGGLRGRAHPGHRHPPAAAAATSAPPTSFELRAGRRPSPRCSATSPRATLATWIGSQAGPEPGWAGRGGSPRRGRQLLAGLPRVPGGKGVATGLGAFLRITPWALIPAAVVWGCLVVSFRFVSLASLCAVIGLPLAILALGYPAALALAGLAVAIDRHRAPLRRTSSGSWRAPRTRFGERRPGSGRRGDRIGQARGDGRATGGRRGRRLGHGPGRPGDSRGIRATPLGVRAGAPPDPARVLRELLVPARRAAAGRDRGRTGTSRRSSGERRDGRDRGARPTSSGVWLERLAPHLAPGTRVLSAAKGIEEERLARMSEVLAEELPAHAGRVAVLSGPTFALEVGHGRPTAAVLASPDAELARSLQAALPRRPSASTRRRT